MVGGVLVSYFEVGNMISKVRKLMNGSDQVNLESSLRGIDKFDSVKFLIILGLKYLM